MAGSPTPNSQEMGQRKHEALGDHPTGVWEMVGHKGTERATIVALCCDKTGGH